MLIKIYKNKIGQIGDTMAWVVATLIIMFILVISVFAASGSSLFGTKSSDKKVYIVTNSDLFATKSFIAYLLTDYGNEKIYSFLAGAERDLDVSSGELAIKIFKGFYSEDLPWLGVIEGFGIKYNPFFGFAPEMWNVQETIKLTKEKDIRLYLLEKWTGQIFQ